MTDKEIIALFEQRNEDGIHQAKFKYGPYCRTLIARILPDREDQEEVLNDLWLRAWESIPPQKPTHLKLYLAKIARNLACSILRNQTAEKRGSGEHTVILDELAECIPGGQTPEEQCQLKELKAEINHFLRTLPRRECDVFLRRYFFSEDLSAIAKRYGIRQNTVSVILHRTRKKLREYLEQEDYL